MKPKYKVGDKFQSVSDTSRIGTVLEVCGVHASIQYYRVNFGASCRPIITEVDFRPFVPSKTPFDNLLQGKIDGCYRLCIKDYELGG